MDASQAGLNKDKFKTTSISSSCILGHKLYNTRRSTLSSRKSKCHPAFFLAFFPLKNFFSFLLLL